MKLMSMMCLGAAGVAAASMLQAQGLPSHKVLTLEVAQTIAREAMASCRLAGFKVTVLVVDDGNRPIVLIHDDGALNVTNEIAPLKATTVLAFGRPSGPPPGTPPDAPPPPPLIPGLFNSEGGLPIMVDHQLIGAVAVSGAPGGEKDAACAQAGLEKVADKLQ